MIQLADFVRLRSRAPDGIDASQIQQRFRTPFSCGMCDHLRRGHLDISELKAVVLDEADEMLNLGFREDMEFILKTTPDTRRTLLFSATFPRGIVALAKQYQQHAFRIEVAA